MMEATPTTLQSRSVRVCIPLDNVFSLQWECCLAPCVSAFSVFFPESFLNILFNCRTHTHRHTQTHTEFEDDQKLPHILSRTDSLCNTKRYPTFEDNLLKIYPGSVIICCSWTSGVKQVPVSVNMLLRGWQTVSTYIFIAVPHILQRSTIKSMLWYV